MAKVRSKARSTSKSAAKRTPKRKRKQKLRKRTSPAPPQTTALATVEKATQIAAPQSADLLSVVPKIKETMANMERVRRFVSRCLNIDLQRRLANLPKGQTLAPEDRQELEIDWGTIPGMDKPFLKQPGAEKFLLWLGLRPKYTTRENDMGNGHIEVVSRVIFYSKKTGEEVFEGPECSCSTMESNYRFRWAEVDKDKVPPDEKQEEMKMSGMGRWKKKGIWVRGKKTGEEWRWYQRVENMNVHDERNKVRQMGQKRGLVKGVRNMGAISEIFTADPSEWEVPDDDDDPTVEKDYTPEGRKIINADGKTPSGRQERDFHPQGQSQKGPNAAQQEIIDRTLREAKERKDREEAAKQTNTAPGGASQNVPPGGGSTAGASPKPKIMVITWSADLKSAAVAGDIAELVPWLKTELGAEWRNEAWVIDAARVADLVFPVQKVGFKIQEIKPPPPGKPLVPAKAVVKEVKPDQRTQAGAPNVQLLIAGVWCYCYDKPLFEYLEKSKGKECEFVFEKKAGPPKITGIVRIGNQRFEADGRTPYIDRSQQ